MVQDSHKWLSSASLYLKKWNGVISSVSVYYLLVRDLLLISEKVDNGSMLYVL